MVAGELPHAFEVARRREFGAEGFEDHRRDFAPVAVEEFGERREVAEREGQGGPGERLRHAGRVDAGKQVGVQGGVFGEVEASVEGVLRVRGLLLATAGLEVLGRLEVDGAAWAGGGTLAVESGATLAIRSSVESTRAADRLRPGMLPRAAILGAWRELW